MGMTCKMEATKYTTQRMLTYSTVKMKRIFIERIIYRKKRGWRVYTWRAATLLKSCLLQDVQHKLHYVGQSRLAVGNVFSSTSQLPKNDLKYLEITRP